MKFSLLCPSRNRIGPLERLIVSLKETVGDPQNVELLVGCDVDDKKTIEMIKRFSDVYNPIIIRSFIREQSEFINRDYYNWLATFATGEFLHIIGDDCVYVRLYWDKVASMKLDDYLKDKPDGVVYGMVEDGTPAPRGEEKRFCCFPIISREAYKNLGFVLHEEIPTWGADTSIYAVYADPRVDRVFKIPEIQLKHISHHCGGGVVRDETSLHVEKTYQKYSCGQILGRVMRLNVPKNVDQLANHIENLKRHKSNEYLTSIGRSPS